MWVACCRSTETTGAQVPEGDEVPDLAAVVGERDLLVALAEHREDQGVVPTGFGSAGTDGSIETTAFVPGMSPPRPATIAHPPEL